MEQLTVPDIARLLGVSRPRVWQLRKKPDFPAPAGSEGGRDFWYEATILRWAASAGRELAARAPLLYRPAVPDRPTEYLGASTINSHVLFVWDTAYGVVCLGYRRAFWDRPQPRDLLAMLPHIDTAMSVGPGRGLWGPDLFAADRETPNRVYEPRWTDVERILGTPAPWWPSPLRRLDEMARWMPGSRPRVTEAVPAVDTSPLLRVATDAPDGSPVNATFLHLVRTIQAQAAEYASTEVAEIEDVTDRDAIALGAVPLPVRPEGEEPPREVRQAAWEEVLNRSDTLAAECVSCALQWDGGRDFPFAGFHELHPTDDYVDEWAGRLRPTERTAAFEVFGDRVTTPLIDTATGLPVARDARGIYWTVVAQALPAKSELAELLPAEHGRVWIRTADGQLYLAPERPGSGVSYGYRGSGPFALAALLNRLLDDIRSPAPELLEDLDPPPGLLSGTTGAWKPGDVVSREELLALRSSE